jgi:tetratricopeptide (TPR) repeat protein
MNRLRKLVVVGVLTLVVLALIGAEAETGAVTKEWASLRSLLWRKAATGLLRGGSIDLAGEAGRRVRSIDPTGGDAWVLSEVADKQEKTAAARQLRREAVTSADGAFRKNSPPRWLVEHGRDLLEAGELAKVEKVLEHLKGVRAKRAGAPLLRAAWLRTQGKLTEAEDQARRLVEDFVLSRLGEAYWEVARIAEARKDSLTAAYFALESFRHGAPVKEAVVRKHLEGWCRDAGVNPVPARAFLRALSIRGAFGARGRPTKLEGQVADRICQRLMEKNPDFWAGDLVLHTRGSFFFYQEKKWELALGLYQESVERFPKGESRCRCLYQSARSLRKLKRLGDAEVAAQRALDACSGNLGESARSLLTKIRRQRLKAGKKGAKQKADKEVSSQS